MRIRRRDAGVDIGIKGLSGASLIGQGGFGVVYKADQRSGRTVAVKILSAPGFDDDTWLRFARECEAVDTLSDHPNVVTVLDSGINTWGRPFIVMEYMARGSVGDRVARDGALAWPVAADIGIKIASAVADAHAKRILHRDIKPQNILLSAYDQPKLADFGVASFAGEQTNSRSVAASLDYAAPELLDGRGPTVATDLYALAATIFTMTAGEPPFARVDDELIQSVIARIVTEPVPDLRPRGVPGPVCDVIERGLAKDPADRFGSATEFADALREIQDLHGIEPTPVAVPAKRRSRPSLTAPTMPRVRRGDRPGDPIRIPLWKRPVAVAAIAALLSGGAATAVAVRQPRGPVAPAVDRQPQTEVAGTRIAPEPERKARAERSPKRRARRHERRIEKSAQPASVSYGAGTTVGGGIPAGAPAPSQDANEAPAQKQVKTKPEPPPPPPAPDLTLWHAYKEYRHAMFTDPAMKSHYQERGFTIEVVGGVYSYQEEGTRPISVNGTTLYSFSAEEGETSPRTRRTLLYYCASNESDDFYTSDRDTKFYYYARGWAVQQAGWVGI